MNAIAHQHRSPPAERFDTVCCVCHRVAWNGRHGGGLRRWLDPATFEQQVGALCEPVSHGMCPDCLEQTLTEAFPGSEGPSRQISDGVRARR